MEKPGHVGTRGGHRDEVASPDSSVLLGPAAASDYEKERPHDAGEHTTSRWPEPGTAHIRPRVETPSAMEDTLDGVGPDRETDPMSAPPQLPDVVVRALDVSRRAGYVSFCRNETGRLLAALAATRSGTMAEFGTGCGVGTAWLRSGVRGRQASIVTAELDTELAKAAMEIFTGDDLVEVLAADWSLLLQRGPFSLLFLTADTPGEVTVERLADLVEPGGLVVVDDLTPCEQWPPLVYGRVDQMRQDWLTDERFTAVEIMVAADASVLLATRR